MFGGVFVRCCVCILWLVFFSMLKFSIVCIAATPSASVDSRFKFAVPFTNRFIFRECTWVQCHRVCCPVLRYTQSGTGEYTDFFAEVLFSGEGLFRATSEMMQKWSQLLVHLSVMFLHMVVICKVKPTVGFICLVLMEVNNICLYFFSRTLLNKIFSLIKPFGDFSFLSPKDASEV